MQAPTEIGGLSAAGDTTLGMGEKNIHRLRVVVGEPWKEALLCAMAPYAPYRAWDAPDALEPGDVAFVVLDTEPQTVLCAVRAGESLRHAIAANCDDHRGSLPTVAQMEQQTGVALGDADGQPRTSAAARALLRFAEEYDVSKPADRTGDSSAAAARILLQSAGRCECCRELVVLDTTTQEEVIIHTVTAEDFAGRTDWPALLCAQCDAAMKAGGFSSVVDFMFSREPACPACGAHRTSTVSYGMPTYDWAMNMPTWVSGGGCCVGELGKWQCGQCGHNWGELEPW